MPTFDLTAMIWQSGLWEVKSFCWQGTKAATSFVEHTYICASAGLQNQANSTFASETPFLTERSNPSGAAAPASDTSRAMKSGQYEP